MDVSQLLTYSEYAERFNSESQPLSRQRVHQLVTAKRLKSVRIGNKSFINKSERIKPSKLKRGPKK